MIPDLEQLSTLFKALSDETRLMILYLLRQRPLCVCEIMGALDITQTKASRHLIYLKNAGLLKARKEDRWVVYHTRDDLPAGVQRLLNQTYELVRETKKTGPLLRRLETILENESLYRQTFGLAGRRPCRIPNRSSAS